MLMLQCINYQLVREIFDDDMLICTVDRLPQSFYHTNTSNRFFIILHYYYFNCIRTLSFLRNNNTNTNTIDKYNRLVNWTTLSCGQLGGDKSWLRFGIIFRLQTIHCKYIILSSLFHFFCAFLSPKLSKIIKQFLSLLKALKNSKKSLLLTQMPFKIFLKFFKSY